MRERVSAFLKRLFVKWTLIGLAIVAGLGLLVWLDYRFGWSGWGSYRHPQSGEVLWGKSLWEWLELLIVPVVLAVGALLFNRSERRAERELATDRAREVALQSYLDKMTELLLEKELGTSPENSEVRHIARARTLTVLRVLDGTRKGILVRFLYDARLIGGVRRVVVDLSGADLSEARLEEVNLEGAILRGAYLAGAQLDGVHLERAFLAQAHLEGAEGAEAYLEGAYLTGAHLTGAYLEWAHLEGACLQGAILFKTHLEGAHLEGADLEGASLEGANVTNEQLTKAKSLVGATMPDGTRHKRWAIGRLVKVMLRRDE